MTMPSQPEALDTELENVLDKHAEYYIKETVKFFQENGESPALSKFNKGDIEAKSRLKKIIAKQVISELKKLHRFDGRDYDNETDEGIDERIEQLQKKVES